MDRDAQVQFIEGTLGPHEVGVMVAIFLFGLVTIQAFIYFRQYPDDPRGVKLLVTVVCAFSLYRRTVTDYGKISDLEQYPEGMCGAFSLSGLIGSLVQSFFAYRLYRLSGRLTIGIMCWILSLVRFGCILFISVTTCQATSPNGNRETSAQRAVDKLIAWTIQTGALTSISSHFWMCVPSTTLDLGIRLMASKTVFANYLLASLNARNDFREDMNRKPTFFDVETPADVVQQPRYSLHISAIDDSGFSTSDHVHPLGLQPPRRSELNG
ncbi:hypothetical protein FPV67DRAFT_1451491 [Lyophyllum atratum]|nr:hypothetical protein FPV67DRAFT_1451491 [Lyophyllum atratum]